MLLACINDYNSVISNLNSMTPDMSFVTNTYNSK